MTKTKNVPSETVGRTYGITRYGVHSRKIGGDGCWYGTTMLRTLDAAMTEFQRLAKGRNVVYREGAILVSMQDDSGDKYEYRVVESEQQITIVACA